MPAVLQLFAHGSISRRLTSMARKRTTPKRTTAKRPTAPATRAGRPSALLDTRIVYCSDCLDQLAKPPDGCVDLIYIDPPFNSNRNYEIFWGETKEKRAFEDRHASTGAYIDYMRPRCVELSRVLKKTGNLSGRSDWHGGAYRWARRPESVRVFGGGFGKRRLCAASCGIPITLPCKLRRSTTAPKGRKTSSKRSVCSLQ